MPRVHSRGPFPREGARGIQWPEPLGLGRIAESFGVAQLFQREPDS